jgi:hypothetical protein
MSLSYANILDRIEQLLQDTSNTTYDVTELGMWIEDALKLLSRWRPLLVDIVFQVESRCGTDATGTASKLTDSVKAQFLAADATNEKVVHNTTDDTWAVVTARDSASVLSLSRDIMDANETYEIYNKRCRNKRQIFIGDMPSEYWDRVVRVEYPIGKERGFRKLGEVIELDVEDVAIQDSDSTLTTLAQVDVLVRFALPQVLCQLTDLSGELSAGAAEGATSIAVDGLGPTELIEVGDQFTLENQRSTYIITAAVTTSGNAATLTFYPPLEAAASDNDDVTFRKSTLSSHEEAVICRAVAKLAMMSNTVTKLDTVNTGGGNVSQNEQAWAMRILEDTMGELRSRVRAIPSKTLPRT